MAGGIRFAKTPEETEIFASEIIRRRFRLPVRSSLIDEDCPLKKNILFDFHRSGKITTRVDDVCFGNNLYGQPQKPCLKTWIGFTSIVDRFAALSDYHLAYKLNFPGKYYEG